MYDKYGYILFKQPLAKSWKWNLNCFFTNTSTLISLQLIHKLELLLQITIDSIVNLDWLTNDKINIKITIFEMKYQLIVLIW